MRLIRYPFGLALVMAETDKALGFEPSERTPTSINLQNGW